MADRIINLLLISDNEGDVKNVQQALKQNHINSPLYVAANGPKALEMLRGNSTSLIPAYRRLILLDLNLESMDGIEFLRQLRADAELRMVPVVGLALSAQDSIKGAAYSLNVAGYILKPITLSNLAAAMATLISYWTLSELP